MAKSCLIANVVQRVPLKAWTKCKTKGDLLKGVDAALLQLPKPRGKEIEHASHFPPALSEMIEKTRVYEAPL